jgi:ABC-type Fe3+-hydroxamate transport system substrate-binding protein
VSASGNDVRVVSLIPSVTETLLAWGIRPVAVTRFCEQPGLRAVGGTKDPDIGAIVALAPDLVVVDREENTAEAAAALGAAGIPLHVLHVTSIGDVSAQLGGLAARLGAVAPPAPALIPEPGRVRAFVPIWRRPWMSINGATYGSSLLTAAGVTNVLAGALDRYPTVTLEEVVELQPDVVLAPSEPYPFSQRQRPELEQVAPVVLIDGHDLFWWGARTPGALARVRALAAAIATPGAAPDA